MHLPGEGPEITGSQNTPQDSSLGPKEHLFALGSQKWALWRNGLESGPQKRRFETTFNGTRDLETRQFDPMSLTPSGQK